MNRRRLLLVAVAVFVFLSPGQCLSVGQGSTIIYRQFHNSEPPATSLFPTNVQPVYYKGGSGAFASYPLDLGEDGILDFEVRSWNFPSTTTLLGLNSNAVLNYVLPGGYPVFPDAGVVAEGQWIGPENPLGYYWYGDDGFGSIFIEGMVPPATGGFIDMIGYVGLQFQIDGQTHYGWLRLEAVSGLNGVLLYDCAYESRPNTPIRAGALPDSDNDGIPDMRDNCPSTPTGAIVDSHGCSIDQLCPCSGPWKNHGDYVLAFVRVAKKFLQEGRITKSRMNKLVIQALISNCGKPPSKKATFPQSHGSR